MKYLTCVIVCSFLFTTPANACDDECGQGTVGCVFGTPWFCQQSEDGCWYTIETAECPQGTECSWGNCIPSCQPNCGGKECGDNGCDGSCGDCNSTAFCEGGVCVTPPPPEGCMDLLLCMLDCEGDFTCFFDCSTDVPEPLATIYNTMGQCMASDPDWDPACYHDRDCIIDALEGCSQEAEACLGPDWCIPECTDLVCGPDPFCSENCGDCPIDEVCEQGQCVMATPSETQESEPGEMDATSETGEFTTDGEDANSNGDSCNCQTLGGRTTDGSWLLLALMLLLIAVKRRYRLPQTQLLIFDDIARKATSE